MKFARQFGCKIKSNSFILQQLTCFFNVNYRKFSGRGDFKDDRACAVAAAGYDASAGVCGSTFFAGV